MACRKPNTHWACLPGMTEPAQTCNPRQHPARGFQCARGVQRCRGKRCEGAASRGDAPHGKPSNLVINCDLDTMHTRVLFHGVHGLLRVAADTNAALSMASKTK